MSEGAIENSGPIGDYPVEVKQDAPLVTAIAQFLDPGVPITFSGESFSNIKFYAEKMLAQEKKVNLTFLKFHYHKILNLNH